MICMLATFHTLNSFICTPARGALCLLTVFFTHICARRLLCRHFIKLVLCIFGVWPLGHGKEVCTYCTEGLEPVYSPVVTAASCALFSHRVRGGGGGFCPSVSGVGKAFLIYFDFGLTTEPPWRNTNCRVRSFARSTRSGEVIKNMPNWCLQN